MISACAFSTQFHRWGLKHTVSLPPLTVSSLCPPLFFCFFSIIFKFHATCSHRISFILTFTFILIFTVLTSKPLSLFLSCSKKSDPKLSVFLYSFGKFSICTCDLKHKHMHKSRAQATRKKGKERRRGGNKEGK